MRIPVQVKLKVNKLSEAVPTIVHKCFRMKRTRPQFHFRLPAELFFKILSERINTIIAAVHI